MKWKVGMFVTEWGTGMVDKVVEVDPNYNPPKWVKLRQDNGQEDIVALDGGSWEVADPSTYDEADYGS